MANAEAFFLGETKGPTRKQVSSIEAALGEGGCSKILSQILALIDLYQTMRSNKTSLSPTPKNTVNQLTDIANLSRALSAKLTDANIDASYEIKLHAGKQIAGVSYPLDIRCLASDLCCLADIASAGAERYKRAAKGGRPRDMDARDLVSKLFDIYPGKKSYGKRSRFNDLVSVIFKVVGIGLNPESVIKEILARRTAK